MSEHGGPEGYEGRVERAARLSRRSGGSRQVRTGLAAYMSRSAPCRSEEKSSPSVG